MGTIGWSELLDELVASVAERVSSNVDILRISSICHNWRTAVTSEKRYLAKIKKRFPDRFPTYLPYHFQTEGKVRLLFPTSFFRVTLDPSSKGWLIKTRQVSESSKNLLFPLSGERINPYHQKTLNLLNVGVTEIAQANEIHLISKIYQRYAGQYMGKRKRTPVRKEKVESTMFHELFRIVVVEDMVFAVDNHIKGIWCCKSGQESDHTRWTIIRNEKSERISDIIVHDGQVYVLNEDGAIYWIKLSELQFYQVTSSTPVDYKEELYVREDKRLVEYCGDLCVVHRFYDKHKVVDAKTVHFKVYKMDEELMSWVEVSSLGDKAIIVASDTCFTVLASEYHGCLENAIYFTDDAEEEISVFKLDDKSIITQKLHSMNRRKKKYMASSSSSSSQQSCFDMFTAPFLSVSSV